MPRLRTPYEKAAGKLISAIQKEWGAESGLSTADFSEGVMDAAHHLLQARTPEAAARLLSSLTVGQYLGELWVRRHPAVTPFIRDVEALLPKQLKTIRRCSAEPHSPRMRCR
ncbi:hypothetical protein QLQ15_16595 [Lysobacter sp. LF1]|uniref:Uncharacterized protein n=1 Tax=Lysobacter stagni TaxID=3045172 RepID=A0ABT6XK30_9GAMM|nr:hypothetical protein [Lysobacter sp. LF1]MDI9240525.1 hypothetical protein [Lysobacter sp. LF1]